MVVKVLRALDDDADGFLKDRARDAVVDALTCLAQGYHSYHLRDKIAHYAKSREMLCAAASLLTLMAAGGGEGERLQKLSVELQGEPLGSVTGLIRALETKKRKQHGAEDAGTGNLR